MKSIYKVVFLFILAAVSLTACEQDEAQESREGKVAIIPQLAGMYVVTPGNGTKTRAANHEHLSTIINLPEGATLRLIAQKNGETSPTIQDYVVRTSGGGSQSLYPCTIDDATGEVDPDSESKDPLYLTSGDYTFRAVSPAHKFNKTNSTITIGNGESVVANNSKWTQTEPTSINVAATASQVVLLKPMMQLTARMTFTIAEGAGVSALSVMQDGIEIDGIREGTVELDYSTGLDSIAAIIANNNERIYIKEKDIIVQDKSIRGEVCLLPIDNRPYHMTIILNLLVNGVPTQFTYSIVDKILYAGYSYDYIVTVNVKDHITVANWQETSWSTIVSPQP
ncbi:BF2992 family fimbrillin-A clan protein [Bacteroides sp. UBA939]|uniref:BF2992 family fimbrillin-A clan protein n=1 Tax=Bacteroides sp. UBA939 TaxID=1946092 RepID=UPI0025BAC72D|nr:BF2992 family fimbrillin-A clan protein [Bacteroides sp. UBA939]